MLGQLKKCCRQPFDAMKKPEIIFEDKSNKPAWEIMRKKYVLRHKLAGLCRECSNPVEINPLTGKNYVFCSYHRAHIGLRHKLFLRKWRSQKRKRGLCIDCGKASISYRCQICNEKANAREKLTMRKRRANKKIVPAGNDC